MMRAIFIFLLSLFLFTSCQSDTYQAELAFETACWNVGDTLTLDLELPKGEPEPHYARIGVTFDQEYPYQNLYLKLFTQSGLDLPQEEGVHMVVMEPDGTWKADISNGKVQWETRVKMASPKAGPFSFKLVQYMRDESICGIHKIGLSIE